VILADLELGRHRFSLALGVVGRHASNDAEQALSFLSDRTGRSLLVGASVDVVPAVGELVCRSGQWMVQPPEVCPRGHRLRPGRMLVGTIACSCGRHITWECECGEVTYGLALTPSCSVLDGPARIRSY
jgi:hypothetical protein